MSDARLEVRDSPERGRGVFATAAIPVGTVVVRAIPAACVPNDACLQSHCCVCLGRAESRWRCDSCNSAVFCDRCHRSVGARLVHDDECASLRLLLKATLARDRPADTKSLRLLLRLLLWRWRCSQPERPQYVGDGEDDWWGDGDACGDEVDDVMALCEPPEGLRDDEHGGVDCDAAFFDMAAQARYYLPAEARLSRGVAADLMAKVYANGLALYEVGAHGKPAHPREVGWAVSASVAMFNHDCTPNVDWALDRSGCLVVRTLRPVRRGEELCLSYLATSLPPAERRAQLQAHFGFECGCDVCGAIDAAPDAAQPARKRNTRRKVGE